MSEPAHARAVGFDFDHTLGLDNGLETTAFSRLAAELGRSVSERDPMWSAFIDDELARFRASKITMTRMVDDVVGRLGRATGPQWVERYRELCLGLVDELVVPIHGAREVLAALDQRAIPTAILTNGWSPLQQRKVARALDYRGPVLVSDELGISKPEPAAFGKLVDVLRTPRAACWFVGDNPKSDVAGAQWAGLVAVWFDWEHIAYPTDAPAPDARIEALGDLLALVPGPADSTQNVRP